MGSGDLQSWPRALVPTEYLVHYNASKHTKVLYHFVRKCLTLSKLAIGKISKEDNVANAMAKCLSADRFRTLSVLMGVKRTSEESRQSASEIVNAPSGAFTILCTLVFFVNTPIRGECGIW